MVLRHTDIPRHILTTPFPLSWIQTNTMHFRLLSIDCKGKSLLKYEVCSAQTYTKSQTDTHTSTSTTAKFTG